MIFSIMASYWKMSKTGKFFLSYLFGKALFEMLRSDDDDDYDLDDDDIRARRRRRR